MGTQQRHVVITGGASGLGLGCAWRFGTLAGRITICDVNESAGQEAIAALAAAFPQIEWAFIRIDLADRDSITAGARALIDAGHPIDVLVNNAGIYPPARRTLSAEGFELTFAIAYLGHFRLTAALWPLLAAAPAARVVSISSMVQRRARLAPDPFRPGGDYLPIRAYETAKLACLIFALELQRRIERHPHIRVRSYAAHPGVCRSQLGRNRRRSDQDGWWARLSYWVLAHGIGRFGQSPEVAASSVIEAALSDRYAGGAYIGPQGFMEIAGRPGPSRLGMAAKDRQLALALWSDTESLAGTRFPI